MEANSTTIEKVKSNFNTNISYLNNASKEQTKEETVIMKYKNLPHSLNSISLKARFTYRKMLDLIDNNDKDDLTLEDLNDPKKEKYIKRNQLGELISHLSDFYQIFIDNLNGEEYSLLEMMEYKDEKLFIKCLDLGKVFMSNIYISYTIYYLPLHTMVT